MIYEPDQSARNRHAPAGGPLPFERRGAPRPLAARAERSRHVGRALEFTFVTLLGVSAAVVAFEIAHQAIAKPVSSVTAALTSRKPHSTGGGGPPT